jgi:hypothetical protein
MITRFIRKISLFFNPIKAGDVFYGDPVWWVLPRPIEMVLHGLKDKEGNTLYRPVPSEGCYKVTVEGDYDSYFKLRSEVLCNTDASYTSIWKQRSQPRRMPRLILEQYILSALLWREKK